MRSVRYNRKSAPKVKDGRVQKKNNHRLTLKRGFVIDRASPQKGFKHFVTKQDLLDFIELLPEKNSLLLGIERIHLSEGSDGDDGSYRGYFKERSGIIGIAAWRKELVQDIPAQYFHAHQSIFARINLPFERKRDHVRCWFDEAKAKAFLLVHVFIHELGHHHDFTLRHGTFSGEPYAEGFANRLEAMIWPKYVERFGQP